MDSSAARSRSGSDPPFVLYFDSLPRLASDPYRSARNIRQSPFCYGSIYPAQNVGVPPQNERIFSSIVKIRAKTSEEPCSPHRRKSAFHREASGMPWTRLNSSAPRRTLAGVFPATTPFKNRATATSCCKKSGSKMDLLPSYKCRYRIAGTKPSTRAPAPVGSIGKS